MATPLPADLASALEAHPEARAALVFTPRYYGTSGDVAGFAEACHARDLPLVTDDAWAHVPLAASVLRETPRVTPVTASAAGPAGPVDLPPQKAVSAHHPRGGRGGKLPRSSGRLGRRRRYGSHEPISVWALLWLCGRLRGRPDESSRRTRPDDGA
jgi:hypothetical protein